MDDTAAWAMLLRVHAAVTPVLDRELQEAHGLPLSWYDVLLELSAAPGRRLTMSALGDVVVISRSRVSRIVDELVRAGLVERVPNPDDRRSAFAKLTAAGRAKLRAAAPTYLAGIDRHFTGRMSATEAHAVAAALGKVMRAHDASTVVELGPTR